ncbi:hypothetical protein M9Y10_002691 [Tritrichomonas musculus]|uniref:Uncharacterized protein n=1 Tax=Tritrichomonas musculus TaxID=1915356 RepID=A0ABR2LAP1_9EUKA
MSGEVIMMSINEGFFFWRAFKISENCTIKYEQLYSIFAKELEQWAKKNNKISFLNFTHIYQRNASLYIYSDTDVNQKKAVTNIAEEVTLNSEILVRFNTACFNNYKPNFSFLQTKKRMFPTLSKSEANEAIIKGDRVANTSAKTALKFYKCALKYSVFKYAKALYKQKKWRQFSPLIDLLKEENPQNAEVSLMIAKFYEFYDDNVRSIQAYKEALIFSDSPSLLIECSKLYMNTDKYLSSLLLNRSINCDSTNPNVIIRSMIELINNKKYDDVFSIAFRTQKSIKFLAKSFKKNDELSKNFINFFKNLDISSNSLLSEGLSLISILYKNGAVFESLYICQTIFEHNFFLKNNEKDKPQATSKNATYEETISKGNQMNMTDINGLGVSHQPKDPSKKNQSQDCSSFFVDPFIARMYFAILINEGLYKRFVETSVNFISKLYIANDTDAFEFFRLHGFFEEYLRIVSCKQNTASANQALANQPGQVNSKMNKLNQAIVNQSAISQNIVDTNININFDIHNITSRQLAILDCVCAMSIFLFLIGTCNEISSFSSINSAVVKTKRDLPFWQIRFMYLVLHPILDSLPSIDLSQPTLMLIGDETSLMTSYQSMTVAQSPNYDNLDQTDDINTSPKSKRGHKDKKSSQKEIYLLVPNIIMDLSIWKLRKGHKCGQKSSFWSRILSFDETRLIVLELGNIDCEFEIPMLIKKNRYSSVGKTIEAILNIYFEVIEKIKTKLPNVNVVIHPVIPTSSLSSPIVFEFNKRLKIKCYDRQIQFIDLFSSNGPLDVFISEKSFVKYLACLRKGLLLHDFSFDY